MSHHPRTGVLGVRNLAVLFALASAPFMVSCQDEATQKTKDNADSYDEGVKADKQYDEQQDKLTNCTPQSSVETAPHFVLADFSQGQSKLDDVTLRPVLIQADMQLAWGSGGGGGNGGKGHDRNPNCP